MKKVILILCFLCGLGGLQLLAGNQPESGDSPKELLRQFYGALVMSESQPGPNVFVEGAAFLEMSVADPEGLVTQKVWEFLRQNRNAFLFNGITPEETVEKTRMVYLFTAFPSAETFFDGLFCVGLVAPATPHGKEGVVKEVVFGLERNPKIDGPRYLINPSGIRINGVSLDPLKRSDRREDLFRILGIKTEQQTAPEG